MRAERTGRAAILTAEAEKQSRILQARGFGNRRSTRRRARNSEDPRG